MREAWRRVRGGALTPTRAGASVAIGLAIGVTPLYGLHLLLVLAVCLPLNLDAALAYLAAHISVPFIAPFLTMAELEIGSLIATGHGLPMSLALLRTHGARALVTEMVLGTAVFAPAVALLGGAITFGIVRVVRPPAATGDEVDLARALDRVAARYAESAGRAAHHYVRAKLASDPVAASIARLGAEEALGDVLDAGCGRGQLGVLLLERELATRVVGFDWDAAKVAAATRAARGLAASFRVQDLRTPLDERADTALLIDVLHYLTDGEQDLALRNVARATRRMVLVRELDPARGWRSAVTRLQEAVTTGIGYNRGARVNARPIAALVSVLESEGFAVDVSPCWGATPFSNVLLVARRREAEAP